MALSLNTVWDRLKSVGREPFPIPLDRSISEVMVTREFLSHHYGGNPQETLPSISAKRVAIHGINDFMFPNLDFNPHAPEVPGAPGLFFEAQGCPADDWPKVQRVITRIDSGRWLYIGQYQMTPNPSLTKEEWVEQSILVSLSL